ncbi:hypothetical protein Snoj_33500 [Streptomyces nojiriensis]|uniref:Transposase n=1 Tax=Streptomyces nojiriensis TaxID=66374 RepID=A0ABQ3SMR9_9ACTN|nr:hypothetical protein JYK04_00760 [Streptomyces nojiriensis]GGS30257.1 hypothetical protein GCM10010205_70410 [Streptomyces nojiriensis]GHI69432.1 hypothetical protein Snoj_33500 [Streptomyces nojiriensis]
MTPPNVPAAWSPWLAAHLAEHHKRNAVERRINRLQQWRGLAMRTDKLAIASQAALHLAATLIRARW